MIGAFIQVNGDSRYATCRPVGYVICESGCWEWVGTRSSDGYGSLWDGACMIGAHRAMYESIKGTVPDGLELDHLCRKRDCVNPDHLEPVTARENRIRGNGFAGRAVRRTHCPKGHPLFGANVIVTVKNRPHPRRSCRQCIRDWWTVNHEKRNAKRRKGGA